MYVQMYEYNARIYMYIHTHERPHRVQQQTNIWC